MWNSVLMMKSAPVGKPVFRRLLVALTLCCVALTSYAQSNDDDITPNRGHHSSASYALGDIETINTTNGNLMLNIPLASLPAGRGGHPGFKLLLAYNSKIWDGDPDIAENPNNPNQNVNVTWLVDSDQGGWGYNLKRYNWSKSNRNAGGVFYPPPDCRNTNIWKMKVTFPDGSVREFRPYGYDDPCDDGFFSVQPAAGRSYYSIDGTFARLDFGQSTSEWTLYFDGTRVVTSPNSQRTYDRNGNYIEILAVSNYNNTGHSASIITDQLDRSIVVEKGVGEDYVHASGVNGEPLTTTVKWSSTYVKKTYRAGNHFQFDVNMDNWPVKGVSEIVLPSQFGTNLKYLFGYNGWPTSGNTTPSVGWGELSSVTLPSGARADYQYKMDNASGPLQQAAWVLKNAPTRKDLNYNLEYDSITTPAATETWRYLISDSFSQITAPDGGITKQWFTDVDLSGGGLVYKTELPDGSVSERIWKENRPYLPPGVTIHSSLKVNSYVDKEFVSISDVGRTLVKTAIKEYRRDKNGNLVQQYEYDWVPYSSVTRDGSGKPTGVIPVGAQLQRLNTVTYYCATPDASDMTTNDPDSYDKTSAPLIRGAIASSETGDGAQPLARSEFLYDNPNTTGNLTERRSWDSQKGAYSDPLSSSNSISMTSEYDPHVLGKLTRTTDARGIRTEYTYGSVNGFIDLYPTETRIAAGTNVQRRMIAEYDFHTGLMTRATDPENQISTKTVYDVFGRPTLVQAAVGAVDASGVSIERQTFTEYLDIARCVVVHSDLTATGDRKLVSIQHYDQLGRVRLTRRLEDTGQGAMDETTGVKVQTRYKSNETSSSLLVSNPYRAGTSSAAIGELTMGWRLMTADQHGRVVRAETFAGSSLPAPFGENSATTGAVLTEYNAEMVSVTDQAGASRVSVTDGLGRLAQVVEAPGTSGFNYQTTYTYDALSNLTQVTQGGQAPRSFAYSSLSRLANATYPESGTITYEYDPTGNLEKKVDARHVQTDYDYDQHNRIVSRVYSIEPGHQTPPDYFAAPDVVYFYDSQQLPAGAPVFDRGLSVGKLVAVTYGGGNFGRYSGGYDALGRAKLSRQVTDTGEASGVQTYAMAFEYDLAGHLKSETYPSGKVVMTEYDTTGRLAGVKNQATGSFYAGAASSDTTNRFQYAAHGAISAVRLGNGLWEHTNFNSRLQTIQIGLGSSITDSNKLQLDYTYGTTQNNGNLLSQTIAMSGLTIVQTYGHDQLNRLEIANESGGSSWKQKFLYDRYGNRRIDPNEVNTSLDLVGPNPFFSEANNRIAAQSGEQYQYDEAGNLTRGREGQTYTFDSEGKMTSFNGGSSEGSATYSYDGEGMRVKKKVASTTIIFVYNTTGQLIAEYTSAQPELNGTRHLTSDHLGSTRAVTDSNGVVKARHDYLPFGEEIGLRGGRSVQNGYVDDTLRQKFTSKERDNETQLDNFGARYYANIHGRFTSPDPLYASGRPSQPQSWNRYSYVINRPLGLLDPDGLDWGVTEYYSNGNKIIKYHWFNGKVGKYNGHNYTAVTFDKSGSLDVQQDDGSVVRIANRGVRRHMIAGPNGITITGQDNLDLAGGLARGAILALNSTNPIMTPVINWAFSQVGGLDESSDLFSKGETIGFGTVAGSTMLMGGGSGSVDDVVREGIYEFRAASGKVYVGQSCDICRRLAEHLASGKLLEADIATVRTTAVTGGKTAREVAEQMRINQLGGIVKLENVRNAIGPARAHLLPF